MVLLHHHVVPGLADDSRPQPEPTTVSGDQMAPADCEDIAIQAIPAGTAVASPPIDTIRAA